MKLVERFGVVLRLQRTDGSSSIHAPAARSSGSSNRGLMPDRMRPFAVWGLDMVPLKRSSGGMTHLLVAVDKFTKWIEAKPIKKLDGPTAVKFFKSIIYRFGYPNSIITNNGSNFVKGEFARFCGRTGIQLDVVSVAHPQSNGQVERANSLILSGIKPRLLEPLEQAAGAWE